VARMWYQALVFMGQQPPPATYLDARNAMLDAAVVFHGRYSDPYKAVEDAFAAINVGAVADRVGPQVRLAESLVRSGGPIVVEATDPSGVASISIHLDGGPGVGTLLGTFTAPTGSTLTSPFTVTMPVGSSDGAHTLVVVAHDARQNQSGTSLPFTVDNIAPTVSAVDKSEIYSAVRSAMRVFDFNAADDRGLKKARILVDGADTAFPSSGNLSLTGPSIFPLGGLTPVARQAEWVNLTGAPPGPHTVSIEVTDVAGNIAIADLPPWLSDTTKPSLCALSMTRGSPWSSVILSALASDAESSISKVKYQIDGRTVWTEFGLTTAPGATFSKTIFTTLPGAGPHTFTAECIDQQGNVETSPGTSANFGPRPSCAVTASVLGPSHSTNWAKVVITATASSPASPGSTLKLTDVYFDVDSGQVGAHMSLNRDPGVVYSAAFTTLPLAAGTHSFQARCADSLGQSTPSNTVMLSLQPPGPPPSMDVVFPEAEPNSVSQQSNIVSTIYNVIRGQTHPGDEEWFAIVPPTGKQVCIAGAVTNGSSCSPDINLYVNSQGAPVFIDGSWLLPSRSAITPGSYICASPGSDGFVYINIGGQIFCSTVAYDTLVKFQ
jgi:hypothetical protein